MNTKSLSIKSNEEAIYDNVMDIVSVLGYSPTEKVLWFSMKNNIFPNNKAHISCKGEEVIYFKSLINDLLDN